MAAVAAPAMGPVSDIIIGTIGDSLVVEMGMNVGFGVSAKLADDLVRTLSAACAVFERELTLADVQIIGHGVNKIIPIHSKRLETTGIKTMLITLKYKHIQEDAALGFFRSSIHQ
jgi:hypothetical protein